MKSYPQLSNYINLIDGNQLYSKTNINSASYDELVAISYIGKHTANSIIRHRKIHPFKNVDEVRLLEEINVSHFKKFSPYLRVGERK